MVTQGDIIKMCEISYPLLVVSKNTYNASGHLIACPIVPQDTGSALCVYIESSLISGYVLCDNPRQFDWQARGFSSQDRIPLSKQIFVLDMIQSLFDYI